MNKRAMVLEGVQEHGPIQSADLTERLELSRTQVNYYLTALKQKGLLDFNKKGWFYVDKPAPKPKKEAPAPKPVPTSILLSLTIAREALEDAIKKVESLEQLIYGESHE